MALQIYISILSIAALALCTSANHDSVNFSYIGPNGPLKWGTLKQSFAACSNGKAQSPVDLAMTNIVVNNVLKSLDRNYLPTNATLVNHQYSIGVHFEGKVGDININGMNYSLKQLHWHAPAEHRAHGRLHDAELHLVHFTEDNNNIAVVAQLYRLGVPDPLISKIEDKFYKLVNENHAGNKNANIALGTFDVNELNKKIYRYYRYVGSLTTPPCKEGVIWNVIDKVRTLSKKQLELLKAPLGVEFQHNARPLQPLNGRKIEMYNYHT
ncbi:putative carbonic anhydrase [Medicago truncatula]|uniref:Eukaryotic-type carbonic anhydrase n=1 Tax=Medicago truncatula TaxID=3880 RepID=A0A072VV94_MEDTR|nr:alpha carbonic anhydrase 1, chloroplastic [Medicago truncatula]KEH42020.1 eukaryotic-type carbonic anhydrase [Medicago truncatula]RHN79551.1 putative carbonic anhydrase [Medicago truncatula]